MIDYLVLFISYSLIKDMKINKIYWTLLFFGWNLKFCQ